MPIVVPDYKAPSWCPGGHLQTVIPAKFMPRPAIEYRREKVVQHIAMIDCIFFSGFSALVVR